MDTENDSAQSRLDILGDAYDAQMAEKEPPAESSTPEPAEARTEVAAEEPDVSAATKPRDTSTGKYVKPTPSKLAPSTKPGAKPGQAAVSPPGQKAPGAQAAVPPTQPVAPELKAPNSWKAGERELWAKLPPEARAAVNRRETEINRALNEAAPLRQRDAMWNQVLTPHLPMIQAQGGNPLQVVQNYLQTGAILHSGAPGQKAQLVADIIRNFGVPVEALAAALDGQPQGQQAPQYQQPQQQQFRDPRVDAMLAQREEQLASQGNATVEEFLGTVEFGEDDTVRHTMADILESAARRKSTISLEDAYDAALRASPEHKAVLKQREEAEQAKAQLASTQRTRAAASSVRGLPAAGGTSAQPRSRMDVLSEKYDEMMGS